MQKQPLFSPTKNCRSSRSSTTAYEKFVTHLIQRMLWHQSKSIDVLNRRSREERKPYTLLDLYLRVFNPFADFIMYLCPK